MSSILYDGNDYYLAPPLLWPSGSSGGANWDGRSYGRRISEDPQTYTATALTANWQIGAYRLAQLQRIEMVCVSAGATSGKIILQSDGAWYDNYPAPVGGTMMASYKLPFTPSIGSRITWDFPHPVRTASVFTMTVDGDADVGAWWVTIQGFKTWKSSSLDIISV